MTWTPLSFLNVGTQRSKHLASLEAQSPRVPSRSGLRNLVRALPVVAAGLLACLLYFAYVLLHALPMLQVGTPSQELNKTVRIWGISELVVFHFLFLMFAISYMRTVLTPPGTIPNTPEWHISNLYRTQASVSSSCSSKNSVNGGDSGSPGKNKMPKPTYRIAPPSVEIKRGGGRRHCRWCEAIKPDRAHHCRVCKTCVLRMDHHCPWVFNCIGYGNHKYFMLLIFYTALLLGFAAITQVFSIMHMVHDNDEPFGNLSVLIFAETLEVLLAAIVTLFFIFHMWLTLHDMSTIEFCEKNFRHSNKDNVYDRGCTANLYAAFGRSAFLWLVPIDNRAGDGLSYEVHPDLMPKWPEVAGANNLFVPGDEDVSVADTADIEAGVQRPLLQQNVSDR